MKKRSAAAFLLAGFAVGVIAGVILSNCLKKDDGYFFWSTFFIDDITDKFYNSEEYYITVDLDDSMVEEYRLTSDTFTFQTTGYGTYLKGKPYGILHHHKSDSQR